MERHWSGAGGGGSFSTNEVLSDVSFLKCDLNEDLEYQNKPHGYRVGTDSGPEGVEGKVIAYRWVICW